MASVTLYCEVAQELSSQEGQKMGGGRREVESKPVLGMEGRRQQGKEGHSTTLSLIYLTADQTRYDAIQCLPHFF